jgi:hypothetical protein
MKTAMTKSIVSICAGLALLTISASCVAQAKQSDSNSEDRQDPNKTDLTTAIPAQPVIIWYYCADEDPGTLRIALSSGIFTHVMLSAMHRYDRDLKYYFDHTNFRELRTICYEAGVKVIWERWAWPGHRLKNFRWNDIFDPNYYVEEIWNIRKEAQQIGADFTCFDFEPYGKSPVEIFRQRNMTEMEYLLLVQAVEAAVKQVGQVNYVMPAAFPYPRHTSFKRDMYRPLQKLGRFSIAAHTRYNSPSRLYCKDNIFDVFGAYCKVNPDYSVPAPCFTPREILERKDLWADKKGLFIYPGIRTNVLDVAIEFSKIKGFEQAHKKNEAK